MKWFNYIMFANWTQTWLKVIPVVYNEFLMFYIFYINIWIRLRRMFYCHLNLIIFFFKSCRYVIRAGAGKKQSSKDASGKIAHSAGSSIRRYNELALKKVPRGVLYQKLETRLSTLIFHFMRIAQSLTSL